MICAFVVTTSFSAAPLLVPRAPPALIARHRCPPPTLLFGIGKRKKQNEQPASGIEPSAEGDSAAALIMRADALHAKGDAIGAFEILQNADTSQDEVAWRAARAHHDLAEESAGDAARREQLLRDGLAIADAARARAPSCGPAIKWYAITLGRLGDYLPTKEKVANSFEIKNSLEAAAALLPADASVQTALGQWCFKVAGISWVERNAAKLLFGTPPESSYEEALAFLEASHGIRPSKKASLLAAQSHANLKQAERSEEWFRICLDLPSVGQADAEADDAARKALGP